ncbi:hypothetical protein QEN19_001070 [Hanseniaspora menglaensis]
MLVNRFVSQRSLYTVPEFVAKNLPKVYKTQEQYDLVAKEQHGKLVEDLNQKVAQTIFEPLSPIELMERLRNDKTKVHIFNNCSHLINNHLFIENILPPVKPVSIDNKIVKALFDIYKSESLEDLCRKLKTEMNQKLIGQGFFYIIEEGNGKISTLFSNNQGTPLISTAGLKFQDLDLNGGILRPNDYKNYNDRLRSVKVALNEKAKVKASSKKNIEEGQIPGSDLKILAIINLWDYAFIKDYGIGNVARETYFENCLAELNWDVVLKRLEI